MVSENEVINRVQGLTIARLRVWVKRGWVAPEPQSRGVIFSEVDIARLQLIRQLKTDLSVNNAAIPIVLSLIDQVHGLRYELRSLARAVEAQQRNVQKKILDARNRDDK